MPLWRTPSPTSRSLKYAAAVSAMRYPLSIAASTARTVSAGGLWNTPSPKAGMMMLHVQEDTTEIDVDDSVPLFFVVVRGRCRFSRLNPRVVEGGIEPAKGFHGLVQSRLHLLSAPHISPDRESAAALFLDQAFRLLIALVGY